MQGDRSLTLLAFMNLPKLLINDLIGSHPWFRFWKIAGKNCKKKNYIYKTTSVTNYKKKNLKWILSKIF